MNALPASCGTLLEVNRMSGGNIQANQPIPGKAGDESMAGFPVSL